jgi:diaminohydroxyphosphoribosylaminopyrimidine deaminase/5-amino-6-(5-phosphoribosylamino)uracil reductase
MQRALELAARGQGAVEPNPMVGCVIVQGDTVVGEGWHQRFGGPHAEIEAMRLAGEAARGAEMFVTLEPCCHFGKTPPCTSAVIAAGLRRVIIAMADPFPKVAGQGIEQLRNAGVEVVVGLQEKQARDLNAPYLKLIGQGRPWVIAKWAMSLDGKIATRSGDSKWISNEKSRQIVHQLRGRIDAIIVGNNTVIKDDPLLTARPAGPRIPIRIVLDANASLPLTTKLVCTSTDAPVLVVVAENASEERKQKLIAAGCQVFGVPGLIWNENSPRNWTTRLPVLLDELGRRRLTNVLVEGGAMTLGGFRDLELIDEYHVFIAPKIIGGYASLSPLRGVGANTIDRALQIHSVVVELLDDDVYVHGRVRREEH